LGKNHARNQHGLRKDLEDWLPELESLPVPTGRQLMPSLHSRWGTDCGNTKG
jgi:hypothetical protein